MAQTGLAFCHKAGSWGRHEGHGATLGHGLVHHLDHDVVLVNHHASIHQLVMEGVVLLCEDGDIVRDDGDHVGHPGLLADGPEALGHDGQLPGGIPQEGHLAGESLEHLLHVRPVPHVGQLLGHGGVGRDTCSTQPKLVISAWTDALAMFLCLSISSTLSSTVTLSVLKHSEDTLN